MSLPSPLPDPSSTSGPSRQRVLTTSLTFSILSIFIAFLGYFSVSDNIVLQILVIVLPIFFSAAAILSVTQAALGRLPYSKQAAIFFLSPVASVLAIAIFYLTLPYLLMMLSAYDVRITMLILPRLMVTLVYWPLLTAGFMAIFRRRIPVIIVPAVCGAALMGDVLASGISWVLQHSDSLYGPIGYSIASMIQSFFPLTTLGLLLHRYAPIILDHQQLALPYEEETIPPTESQTNAH